MRTGAQIIMDHFLIALGAVFPFFVYMTVGYVFNRIKHVKPEVIKEMNTLIFRIFFPLMMFANLYKIDAAPGRQFGYVAFCIASVLVLIVIPAIMIGLSFWGRRCRFSPCFCGSICLK